MTRPRVALQPYFKVHPQVCQSPSKTPPPSRLSHTHSCPLVQFLPCLPISGPGSAPSPSAGQTSSRRERPHQADELRQNEADADPDAVAHLPRWPHRAVVAREKLLAESALRLRATGTWEKRALSLLPGAGSRPLPLSLPPGDPDLPGARGAPSTPSSSSSSGGSACGVIARPVAQSVRSERSRDCQVQGK